MKQKGPIMTDIDTSKAAAMRAKCCGMVLHGGHPDPAEVVEALEELQARAEQAEAERDELDFILNEGGEDSFAKTIARAEQAKARVTELEATNHALRAALDVSRTQDREPDYCHDKSWDYTMGWDDWPELVDGTDPNEPMPIYTLYKGPRKWAAQVAVSWDTDGHAEDFDTKIFDTEKAARAALSREGGE